MVLFTPAARAQADPTRGAPAPSSSPPAVAARERPAPPEWRRNYYCGVNGLYVILKMLGRPVDYERLCRQASVGPHGSNMAELARLARTYGVSLTPVRADRSSIGRWPLPALVHQRNDVNAMGHYILLLGRGKGLYTTLDCTSGQILHQKEGDFLARWSGYVMLRSEPFGFPPRGWGPYLWVTACLWALAYGVLRWLQSQARCQAMRPSKGHVAVDV